MEEERRELEAIAATLGNSSRLLRLITYIGEKYFQGKTDKLHEYDIATEVFGRSKDTFNAGEDAIVRVEAHRLRKRLTEYYAGEGKDHPIHLSIPPGSYVPIFTRPPSGPAKLESEVGPDPPTVEQGLKASGAGTLAQPGAWPYIAAIAALGLTILSGYLLFRAYSAKKDVGAAPSGAAASSVQQTVPSNAAPYVEVPLRILAGYTGKPQIDTAGNVWQPDQNFHLGGTWNRPDTAVARTTNPMLFKHWRNGNFTYDLPLRPGVYQLHLYFVATEPDSSDFSTFSVFVNGNKVLAAFDVRSDALGANIADERVFRDVTPGSDGILHLGFVNGRGLAMLNAIEVLPGTPHRQLPIRLVTQPTPYTDHSGQFWRPDDHFMNGYTGAKRMKVEGTSDPDLFAAERYGHFTYTIPVDTRDRYTLILHFAEFYFGRAEAGGGGEGSRVFRVLCNGNTLLDNFDIYKEAGSLHALTKTFYHLKPTAQGKLDLTFEPIANNATVSGIEVLDESQ
jgi:Malectin domain